MTPTDQSSLLARAIDIADSVMTRPAIRYGTCGFEDLADAIKQAVASPVETSELRFVDEFASLLMTALTRIVACRQRGDDARAMAWSQIAGVLLPMVRSQFARAIAARQTVRPSP